MSGRRRAPRGGGGEVGLRTEPTIKDNEGRAITPIYTQTLRAKTDNDNLTHRSLCGETVVEGIGEEEWNVTLEGIVTLSQLETLFDMRPAANKLTIVGEARVHRNVNFDRFIYEQNDELNTGDFDNAPEGHETPLFKYQLQTKDDDS